ncbi:MAG: phospholipase D family protein [Pseudomonadaceae bacterium]|nr:phospholipase D family protein [Pseudomonadaceae bacterium]
MNGLLEENCSISAENTYSIHWGFGVFEPLNLKLLHLAGISLFKEVCCLGVCIALAACSALPDITTRTVSTSLSSVESQRTTLGQRIAPLMAPHPGQSGVYSIANPRESFAMRVLLSQAAERTLDLQYYIWHDDTTGTLLMSALYKAAERGVRVRLLLDDNGTAGIDDEMWVLDLHPNIEVRLFNPFLNRSFKALGYLTDFSRLNRRMHNKSFTADGQATVIGGRNIGDEYFGATTGVLKADLDALLVGSVVEEVSMDFDRYWASQSSYPVADIVESLSQTDEQRVLRAFSKVATQPAAKGYLDAIEKSDFISRLLKGEAPLLWSEVRLVTDDPAKGLESMEGEQLLIRQLDEILAKPQSSVMLVSPYFVPTKAGTEAFVEMVGRGVQVHILTNALEATDVLPVHAGYAKRRKTLLASGVKLYEMMRLASGGAQQNRATGFGSSASSLHAKTFTIDGKRVFIGSFNFDPRSMHLNTELGFVIENPVLARDVEQSLTTVLPALAYEVRLDDKGDLYWLDNRGETPRRFDHEPNSGWFKRASVAVLKWLPIEWLL